MGSRGAQAVVRHSLFWAIAWVALIAVITLMPPGGTPRFAWLDGLHLDKVVHFVLFQVLAMLLVLVLAGRGASLGWLWAFLGATAYGALIELLQEAMGLGRTAEATDLLADAVGAAMGVLAIQRWLRRR